MEEVNFMPNDDVKGYSITYSATVAKPGKLYAAFPTKAQGDLCLPTEEIGLEIYKKVMKKLDESTGFVKYVV